MALTKHLEPYTLHEQTGTLTGMVPSDFLRVHSTRYRNDYSDDLYMTTDTGGLGFYAYRSWIKDGGSTGGSWSEAGSVYNITDSYFFDLPNLGSKIENYHLDIDIKEDSFTSNTPYPHPPLKDHDVNDGIGTNGQRYTFSGFNKYKADQQLQQVFPEDFNVSNFTQFISIYKKYDFDSMQFGYSLTPGEDQVLLVGDTVNIIDQVSLTAWKGTSAETVMTFDKIPNVSQVDGGPVNINGDYLAIYPGDDVVHSEDDYITIESLIPSWHGFESRSYKDIFSYGFDENRELLEDTVTTPPDMMFGNSPKQLRNKILMVNDNLRDSKAKLKLKKINNNGETVQLDTIDYTNNEFYIKTESDVIRIGNSGNAYAEKLRINDSITQINIKINDSHSPLFNTVGSNLLVISMRDNEEYVCEDYKLGVVVWPTKSISVENIKCYNNNRPGESTLTEQQVEDKQDLVNNTWAYAGIKFNFTNTRKEVPDDFFTINGNVLYPWTPSVLTTFAGNNWVEDKIVILQIKQFENPDDPYAIPGGFAQISNYPGYIVVSDFGKFSVIAHELGHLVGMLAWQNGAVETNKLTHFAYPLGRNITTEPKIHHDVENYNLYNVMSYAKPYMAEDLSRDHKEILYKQARRLRGFVNIGY